MTNMTLAIPSDLHALMQKHKEIKWTEVARQAMRDKAENLELLEKILKKSKITEKDAKILGEKIKRGIAKRHQ